MDTAELRRLNMAELTQRAETSEAAAEQLRRREQVEETCWAVLAGLGFRYSGTVGWHVGAYVDEDRRLGFVSITDGVAVGTDVVLDPAVVEAGTVPNQPEGPQVSGAVAWSSPDPGEAHHASAPPGWTQLAVDLRARRKPTPMRCSAHIVMWGLGTCYDGKRGVPGYTMLDGQFCYPDHDGEDDLPPDEWPETDTMPELRRIATAALADIAGNLTTHVPTAAGDMPDVNATLRRLYTESGQAAFSYDAAGAARLSVHGNQLADTAITRLYRLANAGSVVSTGDRDHRTDRSCGRACADRPTGAGRRAARQFPRAPDG
ncbi:MAG: hypothetical protein ACRDRO_04225 [Pseudonocardiaceae bacterium]